MNDFRPELPTLTPWLNAAGSLGFRPPRSWSFSESQGAFVTNPVSLRRRTTAESRAMLEYPGGFLLHTGHPNLGLRAVLNEFGQRWRRSHAPVWVHLLGQTPGEVAQMVEMLEGRDEVSAIELGIPPDAAPDDALMLVRAAASELPLAVSVPVTEAGADWLMDLLPLGVGALVLGPPRGTLAAPAGELVSGRLYGPALFPLVLAGVRQARRTGLPVIAGCGVYRKSDGEALLSAGAWAVQLDTVLWKGESV
jgi:dihydroorotate dehydrogenase (NAD+) catalytic subunit